MSRVERCVSKGFAQSLTQPMYAVIAVTAALGVAESNLEACRRLRPSNRALEARVIGRLGSIHLVLHNWSKARQPVFLATA